ncbi:MAG: eCIS core domain-containing protein [Aureispira sp.]
MKESVNKEQVHRSISTEEREGHANDQSDRQQQEQDWTGMILNSPKMKEQQAMADQIQNSPKMKADQEKVQQKNKENKTGLPEELKLRMEQKFKVSLDDVEVYYNSNQPAMFGALAYAIGNKIYIGPGQEKHLEQELAHVIQQKLGLAKGSSKDQVNIDPNLETQALNMADEARQTPVEDKVPEQQPVMQPQQEVMQLQGDEELIQQLDALSRGETLGGEVDIALLKAQAVDSADAQLQGVTGEDNFAELLMLDIKGDINKAYTQIKQGQSQAIDSIQGSINDENARQEMNRAMLFAFAGIAVAWLPLAGAHMATVEAKLLSQVQGAAGSTASDLQKIPKYVTAIKALGTSQLPGAINSTVSAINGLVKTKPQDAKATLNNQADILHQKTTYAVYSSVLSMAGNVANEGGEPLSDSARTVLKAGLLTQILQTVLPDYKDLIISNNYAGIAERAKTDFLKQTIIETGQLDPADGLFETEEEIEGNSNKTGHEVAEHAVNAMGGEEQFASSLDNPHEMAYGTLNVTLRKLGLSVNATDEEKLNARTTDFLAGGQRFALNIDNAATFTTFLKDQHGYRAQKFVAQSGAIKDLKNKYPMSSSMFGGKATTYNFTFDDVTVSNAMVEVKPEHLSSILDGKVVDLQNFNLEFDTNGVAKVYELTIGRTSGYGGSLGLGDLHEEENISGSNTGIVNA